MSVMGAIVGEFISSDHGLGYIIINSQYAMDTANLFVFDCYLLHRCSYVCPRRAA